MPQQRQQCWHCCWRWWWCPPAPARCPRSPVGRASQRLARRTKTGPRRQRPPGCRAAVAVAAIFAAAALAAAVVSVVKAAVDYYCCWLQPSALEAGVLAAVERALALLG